MLLAPETDRGRTVNRVNLASFAFQLVALSPSCAAKASLKSFRRVGLVPKKDRPRISCGAVAESSPPFSAFHAIAAKKALFHARFPAAVVLGLDEYLAAWRRVPLSAHHEDEVGLGRANSTDLMKLDHLLIADHGELVE